MTLTAGTPERTLYQECANATSADRREQGLDFRVNLELREVEITDSLSMLRGVAVPYEKYANIGGLFMEAFAAGSLSKSIRERKQPIPLKLSHSATTPQGIATIGHASEWIEESRGLVGVWNIDPDDLSQAAAVKAQRGSLTGLSIEFSPIRERDEWDFAEEWNPALGEGYIDRVLRREARLGAVALVETPAYVQAGVERVRAALGMDPNAKPHLDEWKRELGRLRDA